MSMVRKHPNHRGKSKRYKKSNSSNISSVAQQVRAREKEILFAKLINTANQCRNTNQFTRADELFTQAKALNAKSELLYFNRGMLHYSMGNQQAMERDFIKARKLAPKHADMLQKMAVPYTHTTQYQKAIEVSKKAITLNPRLGDAWMWLARAYFDSGQTAQAYRTFEQGHQRCPEHVPLMLAYKLFLSMPLPDTPSILKERARLEENIDWLMQQDISITHPQNDIQFIPSIAAYHGYNDKHIREKFAKLMLRFTPTLEVVDPHCQSGAVRKPGPIRLGFVSEVMHVDTTSQFLDKLLALVKNSGDFEIFIYTNSPISKMNPDRIKQLAHHCILLGSDLKTSRSVIGRTQPDILIYHEAPLRHVSYFLSFARLAPIQCTWAGFPVTTGVPNIDYYLSTSGAEPEDYREHYTEELLMFDSNVAVFTPPNVDHQTLSKQGFGMPKEDCTTYMCPVILRKLHPDMDDVFARILAADPKARIILFDAEQPGFRAAIDARLAKHISDEDRARIIYLSHLPKDAFVHVLTRADVVLDCLHFSFGTTAFLCYSQAVPFVTCRGDFLRSRGGGAYMYGRIDMLEMVANDVDEFVNLALRMGRDHTFRDHMQRKLRSRAGAFFEEGNIAKQFMDTCKRLFTDQQKQAA